MWRLRIDQCWKPKRVGLRVSKERDSSQVDVWLLLTIWSDSV
jgi:hypothetical protein